jgi:hypothetical protein
MSGYETRRTIDLSEPDVARSNIASSCRQRNGSGNNHRWLLVVYCPKTRVVTLALQIGTASAIQTAHVTILPPTSDWQEKDGEKHERDNFEHSKLHEIHLMHQKVFSDALEQYTLLITEVNYFLDQLRGNVKHRASPCLEEVDAVKRDVVPSEVIDQQDFRDFDVRNSRLLTDFPAEAILPALPGVEPSPGKLPCPSGPRNSST